MSVLTPQCFGEGRLTSGGGRLAGVDVADDDDVDVNLFLTALLVSCLVGDKGEWQAQDATVGTIEGPERRKVGVKEGGQELTPCWR